MSDPLTDNTGLDAVDRQLLNDYQRNLPLVSRPFQIIARQLRIGEQEVLRRLRRLFDAGLISRIGPVFAPRRLGASTLAAMAVPAERLEQVAALVSACPEVNHNYEREHRFNLWFVVTATDQDRLTAVLTDIESRSGLPVLVLPLERDYHIDLGFIMRWDDPV